MDLNLLMTGVSVINDMHNEHENRKIMKEQNELIEESNKLMKEQIALEQSSRLAALFDKQPQFVVEIESVETHDRENYFDTIDGFLKNGFFYIKFIVKNITSNTALNFSIDKKDRIERIISNKGEIIRDNELQLEYVWNVNELELTSVEKGSNYENFNVTVYLHWKNGEYVCSQQLSFELQFIIRGDGIKKCIVEYYEKKCGLGEVRVYDRDQKLVK